MPNQQQQPETPRTLAQSDVSRFIELFSSYTHPQYFNSVRRREAGMHTLGATLFQLDANELPIKLELNTEEMITLVSSYLHFLVDFNLVRHDKRLTQAFIAYMTATETAKENPSSLSLDGLADDDSLGDLDDFPF